MPAGPDQSAVEERPAWARVGELCARAAVSAIVVGLVEAAWMSRRAHGAPDGFALVVAALWVPPMIALGAVAATSRVVTFLATRTQTAVMALGYAVFAALVAFVVLARLHQSAPMQAAPLEIVAAVTVTVAIAAIRLHGAPRRSVAIAGVLGVIALQLFAIRWIDQHRGWVELIRDHGFVPAVVVRTLFPRVQ
ncbi:MAG: hypothetical protein ACHREM_04850 [Polyangiales bacterium]